MMIRIGLTGGIASGKSTVASHLCELGARVIDYDRIAAQVVAPGGVGLHRIAQAFGPRALTEEGELDRAWIAEQVFGPRADPDARDRLDAIEHPLVYASAERTERELLRHERGSEHPLVIVHDVPLLAEVIDTIPFSFDHIVTVEAPTEVRVERMMRTRGMSRRQAEDRIRHQPNREERLRMADAVVDSNQSLERMFETVDRLYARWTGGPAGPTGFTGMARRG